MNARAGGGKPERLGLLVCATALLVPSGALTAASFDCSKASTPQEKAVCADPKLSKLDDDLAAAYRNVLAQLSPAGAEEVRQDERAWVLWLRQACPDRNSQLRGIGVCLTNEYSGRLGMLRNGFRRVAGMTFFPRLQVVTTPDKEKPPPGAYDPGFGVGRFNWPEIDRPTPRQAAWNAAVKRQAVRLSYSPGADFQASSASDRDVDSFYRLRAANEKLIAIELENAEYDYGAAHPNEDLVAFDWWLDRGRALQAEDVFTPGGGWESFLGRRSFEKLKAGEHAGDLYDDDQARKAAADGVKRVDAWTLGARGLEVRFGEYSVAPRYAGMLSVELSWEELKPYLASGFDPAGLPEALETAPP